MKIDEWLRTLRDRLGPPDRPFPLDDILRRAHRAMAVRIAKDAVVVIVAMAALVGLGAVVLIGSTRRTSDRATGQQSSTTVSTTKSSTTTASTLPVKPPSPSPRPPPPPAPPTTLPSQAAALTAVSKGVRSIRHSQPTTSTMAADTQITAGRGTVTNCGQITNQNDTNRTDNPSCVTAEVTHVGCDLTITTSMGAAPTSGPITHSPSALSTQENALAVSATTRSALTVTLQVTNVSKVACQPGGQTVIRDDPPPGLTFTDAPIADRPGWSCSLERGGATCANPETLPAGYAVTLTSDAVVTAAHGSVTNCAQVANHDDSDLTNNESCATDAIDDGAPGPACNLEIAETVTPTPLVSGQAATVTVDVVNLGPEPCAAGPAAGTVLLDDATPGLRFITRPLPDRPGWSCHRDSTGAMCANIAPLPARYAVTFTMEAVVTAPSGSTVTSCAQVSNHNGSNTSNSELCIELPVISAQASNITIIEATVSPSLATGAPRATAVGAKTEKGTGHTHNRAIPVAVKSRQIAVTRIRATATAMQPAATAYLRATTASARAGSPPTWAARVADPSLMAPTQCSRPSISRAAARPAASSAMAGRCLGRPLD